MAKRKINKTTLIREALKKNPSASPAKIAEGLKKHGISAQYVSTIKSTTKTKGSEQQKGRKTTKDEVSVSDLVKASKLAEDLGGVAKAQEILNVLAKINRAK